LVWLPKQGIINFGQKMKALEPDNLFVNNVSVPRQSNSPLPSPPFLCLQFCLFSCFYFCPTFSFMFPIKITEIDVFIVPKKNWLPFFPCSIFFWLTIFLMPTFFWVPNSSGDIMSHKVTLGATSSKNMRPPVANATLKASLAGSCYLSYLSGNPQCTVNHPAWIILPHIDKRDYSLSHVLLR
jgi:hypothetical protein